METAESRAEEESEARQLRAALTDVGIASHHELRGIWELEFWDLGGRNGEDGEFGEKEKGDGFYFGSFGGGGGGVRGRSCCRKGARGSHLMVVRVVEMWGRGGIV